MADALNRMTGQEVERDLALLRACSDGLGWIRAFTPVVGGLKGFAVDFR